MTHPLDGVRPRHALCTACGYAFGGVPIRGGVIVCPECGAPVVFEMPRVERRVSPWVWFWWGVVAVMSAGFGAATWVAHTGKGWLVAALAGGVAVLVVVSARVMRRAMRG